MNIDDCCNVPCNRCTVSRKGSSLLVDYSVARADIGGEIDFKKRRQWRDELPEDSDSEVVPVCEQCGLDQSNHSQAQEARLIAVQFCVRRTAYNVSRSKSSENFGASIRSLGLFSSEHSHNSAQRNCDSCPQFYDTSNNSYVSETQTRRSKGLRRSKTARQYTEDFSGSLKGHSSWNSNNDSCNFVTGSRIKRYSKTNQGNKTAQERSRRGSIRGARRQSMGMIEVVTGDSETKFEFSNRSLESKSLKDSLDTSSGSHTTVSRRGALKKEVVHAPRLRFC